MNANAFRHFYGEHSDEVRIERIEPVYHTLQIIARSQDILLYQ